MCKKLHKNILTYSKNYCQVICKLYLISINFLRQQDSLNSLDFYYVADGLTGFSLNGEYYLYKKNLQGDIIGIIDSNGEEIVKYVYDAWGCHKAYNSKTGELLNISSYDC